MKLDTPLRPSDAVKTRLDLYSLSHLEVILGTDRKQLNSLAAHAASYYEPFFKRHRARPFQRLLRPPKKRLIDNPIDPLKTIQKRIQKRLLGPIALPDNFLGGVPGRNLRENALLHLNAKTLVVIDIKNFFPSITPDHVYKVWRGTLNCSTSIASLLTKLTTFRGYLPQGAPTSTHLANLVLASHDSEIRTLCEARRIVYSTWVDDLAFSGDTPQQLIGDVIKILGQAGFTVSHRKIKIMGPGSRKTLNKLVLSRVPAVDRKYVAQIRSAIHKLRTHAVQPSAREAYLRGLSGRINYLRLFDPERAARIERDLNDLPSL